MDDLAETPPDTSVDIDVLANDRDFSFDLDSSTLHITQPPGLGTAAVTGGKVRYTPAAGHLGSDDLRYEVCDGSATCTEGRVAIPTRCRTTPGGPPPPDGPPGGPPGGGSPPPGGNPPGGTGPDDGATIGTLRGRATPRGVIVSAPCLATGGCMLAATGVVTIPKPALAAAFRLLPAQARFVAHGKTARMKLKLPRRTRAAIARALRQKRYRRKVKAKVVVTDSVPATPAKRSKTVRFRAPKRG